MKISIITATFNAGAILQHCLISVTNQKRGTGACKKENGITFVEKYYSSETEHLLLDGGSTDNTLEIAHQYLHIAHVISEPDKGIYDAMNKGIRLATGEIIGILNADDFYADSRVLERVANAFEDRELDACYGDLVYIDYKSGNGQCTIGNGQENPSPMSHRQSPYQILRYWKSGSFHSDKFKWGWMPPHPTFFVRRRVYEKYGLFNLNLGSAADYELMLRFLYKHRIKVAYIPEVLICMRAGGVSNASLSNRLKANRMDRRAWEVNGLKPYPWTLMMKPIRKIPQYWMRPKGAVMVDGWVENGLGANR